MAVRQRSERVVVGHITQAIEQPFAFGFVAQYVDSSEAAVTGQWGATVADRDAFAEAGEQAR